MHPAPSVIAFTTLSGLGFGFLAWLGLGIPDSYGFNAFAFYFVGYALAVGGLLSSVLHLGNKKNAVKAMSQWRSSWLSREGASAIVALLVVAVHAIGRIFFDAALPLIGLIGSILCIWTVFTTSMIYTQLKTVPRWNTPYTPVLFLGYAIAGGALMTGPGRFVIASILMAILAIVQVLAWRNGDGRFAQAGSSIETATGLGRIGKVRLLEGPHSGTNYLLKEMAYQVARKHAEKLRLIGLSVGLVLPVLLIWTMPSNHMIGLFVILLHLIGVAAIRWLFFAEARHVQALYYGR